MQNPIQVDFPMAIHRAVPIFVAPTVASVPRPPRSWAAAAAAPGHSAAAAAWPSRKTRRRPKGPAGRDAACVEGAGSWVIGIAYSY